MGNRNCTWSKRKYKRKHQIEANEACKWLRAAGFPQYSQLYEASEFPIDLSTVENDHEFLDKVELRSLFRRLEILNKCASMKLEARLKISDSDEEEYALSNNWTYERPSRRWSRLETSSSGIEVLRSSSSHDSVEQSSSASVRISPSPTVAVIEFVENEEANQEELQQPQILLQQQQQIQVTNGENGCNSAGGAVRNLLSPRFRRAATEKLKSAKNILKRVESLRHSKRKKKDISFSAPSSPIIIQAQQQQQQQQQQQNITTTSSPITITTTSPTIQQKRNARIFASDSSSYTTAFSHLSVDSHLGVFRHNEDEDDGCSGGGGGEGVENGNDDDNDKNDTINKLNRSSMYDNLDVNESQNQFDLILKDLEKDILSLDQTLNCKPNNTANTTTTTTTTPPSKQKERRDSGVGLSLRRVASAKKRQAAIWHSFLGYESPAYHHHHHQQRHNSKPYVEMRSLNVGEFVILKKMAILKLSSRIDNYAPPGMRFTWDNFVPKFMRRTSKTSSSSNNSGNGGGGGHNRKNIINNKQVFGLNLNVIEQRTGDPLPEAIWWAMNFILRHSADNYAVGIFRKNGQQTRIQSMKRDIEKNRSCEFNDIYRIENLLDVCDIVKSFFRELPECIFTNRYSPIILSIFKHLPVENRFELVQSAVLLLPDENRRVLKCLCRFLNEIAGNDKVHGMNLHNLAVCIAPNLFPQIANTAVSLSSASGGGGVCSSASVGCGGGGGGKSMLDSKEIQDQKAAVDCLRFILENTTSLFRFSKSFLEECSTKIIQYSPSPYDVVRDSGHLKNAIDVLLKEQSDKWKGYETVRAASLTSNNHVDLSYKKLSDGYPIRLWKCSTEICACPETILKRLLYERHIWDKRLVESNVLETNSEDNMDVVSSVFAATRTMPVGMQCELRHWSRDIGKGQCVLVSTSVHYRKCCRIEGAETRIIFLTRFLIEPIDCSDGDKSLVTCLYRADNKGNSADWYKRQGGLEIACLLSNLRESFNIKSNLQAQGPETNL